MFRESACSHEELYEDVVYEPKQFYVWGPEVGSNSVLDFSIPGPVS